MKTTTIVHPFGQITRDKSRWLVTLPGVSTPQRYKTQREALAYLDSIRKTNKTGSCFIGQEFIHHSMHPWSGRGLRGIERRVVRCRVVAVFETRMEYVCIQAIEITDACPGTDFAANIGKHCGGMVLTYWDECIRNDSVEVTDTLVSRLAAEFDRVLREDVTPEQYAAAVAANRIETDPHTCHAHDYCDANVTMAEAFENVTGRYPDIDDDDDLALWNAAYVLWWAKFCGGDTERAR